MTDLIGKDLGDYRILEEIGRGGMATVYRAVDTRSGGVVALKVLPPYFQHDPTLFRRFRREAEAATRLRHPHIVRIYEAGQDQGTSYIVMEYVPYGSLRDRLLAGRPLDLNMVLAIMLQIASALDYAASQGVLHRDIKPGNILLGQDEQGRLRAMLADFGVARTAGQSAVTQEGSVIGTPQYMSPEQAKGKPLDPLSDLYSLGVVLYQMLTGQVPFESENTPAILHAHVYDPPRRPSALNRRLGPAMDKVLSKALAKRPEDRFQSGAEMVGALRRALREKLAEAPTRVMTPAPWRRLSVPWARLAEYVKVPWVAGGLAAVAGVMCLVLGAVIAGNGKLVPAPAATVPVSTLITRTPTPTSTTTLTPTATPMPTATPTQTPVPPPCFDARFQRLEDIGGATQEVRGCVYNMNGRPLKGAVVEIYVKGHWSQVNKQALTMDNGGFAFIGYPLSGNTNNEYILRVIGMPNGALAYNTWDEPYTFKFNTTHDRAVVFIYQVSFRADLCYPPSEPQ